MMALAGCMGAEADAKAGPPYGDAGAPRRDASGALSVVNETTGDMHPGDTVILRAEASKVVESWSWQVSSPAGDSIPVELVDPATGWRRVKLSVGRSGSHTVQLTAKLPWGQPDEGTTIVLQVKPRNAKPLGHEVRIIPPAKTGYLPATKTFDILGEDITGLTWQVEAGQEKSLHVTADGKKIDAYLRIMSDAKDVYPRDLFLPGGEGKVRVDGVFHALVLPAGAAAATIAPNLLASLSAATLQADWDVVLAHGTKVGGTVADASSGLAGATVTIHCRHKGSAVAVPSTLAVTDASGAFALETQTDGDATLTVVPPAAKALPIAIVEGFSVPKAAQGWSFTYDAAPAVSASGQVLRAGESKGAAGATVVLTMQRPKVGRLELPGVAQAIDARGRFQLTLTADESGVLRHPETKAQSFAIPAGDYVAEVWPGKDETPDQGYLREPKLTLSASSPAIKLALARRARLEGTVVDRDGKPVEATVSLRSGTTTFVATTAGSGLYSVYVDKSTYTLVARPVGQVGVRLASSQIAALDVSGDKQLAALKLPAAALIAGKLTTSFGDALPGALIRIACRAADCISGDTLDEALTKSDGRFELRVPIRESLP
jgi:hypothetical protein